MSTPLRWLARLAYYAILSLAWAVDLCLSAFDRVSLAAGLAQPCVDCGRAADCGCDYCGECEEL